MMALTPTINVSGTVISPNNADISARVDGQLLSIAQVGDRVARGGVLATLSDDQLLLQQQVQQAAIDNIEHRLVFLKSEVQRLSSLASKSMTSQTELEERIADRGQAVADLAAARAELAQLEVRISYLEIRAPFDGIVTARLAKKGELVEPGSKIVHLVDTNALELTAALPLSVYAFVKSGQQVAISSQLGRIEAPIRVLVPVADQRSHQMEIRVDMSAHLWPVGLHAKVAVPSGPAQQALAVPRDALVLRRGGSSVFRINGNSTAEQVQVSTGLGAGAFIQVIGEIKPGDRVVIRGAERLATGQKVSIRGDNRGLVDL